MGFPSRWPKINHWVSLIYQNSPVLMLFWNLDSLQKNDWKQVPNIFFPKMMGFFLMIFIPWD